MAGLLKLYQQGQDLSYEYLFIIILLSQELFHFIFCLIMIILSSLLRKLNLRMNLCLYAVFYFNFLEIN
mgnify:FL=1|jgi:hypothetical protein